MTNDRDEVPQGALLCGVCGCEAFVAIPGITSSRVECVDCGSSYYVHLLLGAAAVNGHSADDQEAQLMSVGEQNVSSERTRQLQAVLDTAWARVLFDLPAMALLGETGGRTRETLARAISEAASNGITDTTEMTEFALRALPGFRKPTKLRKGS